MEPTVGASLSLFKFVTAPSFCVVLSTVISEYCSRLRYDSDREEKSPSNVESINYRCTSQPTATDSPTALQKPQHNATLIYDPRFECLHSSVGAAGCGSLENCEACMCAAILNAYITYKSLFILMQIEFRAGSPKICTIYIFSGAHCCSLISA